MIASECIERMMHMSSASLPMLGKIVLISCCDFPNFLNGNCGAKQLSCFPCNCAIGWPAVIESGIGWPCSCANFGL